MFVRLQTDLLGLDVEANSVCLRVEFVGEEGPALAPGQAKQKAILKQNKFKHKKCVIIINNKCIYKYIYIKISI